LDAHDIGKIHGFLLRYRCAATKSTPGKRLRSGESRVADLLAGSSPEEFDLLNGILESQGLRIEAEDDTLDGIPQGGRVFVLVRNATEAPAPFLSTDRLLNSMRLRKNESDTVAASWFIVIWFIHLALIYTLQNRTTSDVSGYVKGIFSEETLEKAVSDHVEQLRGTGILATEEDALAVILVNEQGADIRRRTKWFLEAMEEAGLLQEDSGAPGIYRQTVLSAIEISRNYERNIKPFIAGALMNSANVNDSARSLLSGKEAKETNNGTD